MLIYLTFEIIMMIVSLQLVRRLYSIDIQSSVRLLYKDMTCGTVIIAIDPLNDDLMLFNIVDHS